MKRFAVFGAVAALISMSAVAPASAATSGGAAHKVSTKATSSTSLAADRIRNERNQAFLRSASAHAALSDAVMSSLSRHTASTGVNAPAGVKTTSRKSSSKSSRQALLVSTGSISGTVIAEGVGPLSGICVNAFVPNAPGGGGASTGADGKYTISGLAAGGYDVEFSIGCGNPDNYGQQWYSNQFSHQTANLVTVTDGTDTGSIDAIMQPGGSISGTVTIAGGGGPLAGICATVSEPDGFGIRNQGTDADGKYTITGLTAGNYLVNFSSNGGCPGGIPSNYASQWYDTKASQNTADTVSVSAGSDTGSINAAMQLGGSISGTVTAGGSPLAGICVNLSQPGGGFGFGNVGTGADGKYTITGLAAGDYLVSFSSNGFCPAGVQSNYATQWWDNQPTQETANTVSVSAGADTGSINAAMQPGGSISGTVSAAGGGPLSGICVGVSELDGFGITGTGTGADGTYTITGLAAGDYLVNFTSNGFCPGGTPSNYASQWYDNKTSQNTANTVSVSAGVVTGSINAVMQPGGSISGTVTAVGDGPLVGICATATTMDGEGIANVGTGADGKYTISGLAAGDYLVNFTSNGVCPNGVQSNFATQWYDNQPTQDTANVVSVSAGADTDHIDAVMQPGGSISGTVTAAGGGPLEGICVNASPPEGQGGSGTNTGSDGKYTITGLPAGDYQVQFSIGCGNSGNYAAQWYDNQPTQETATSVPVTVGADTGSINASMQPGGSISGTVTAEGVGPLAGICVGVFTLDGSGITNTATGADGKYTITGVGAADYIVGFDSSGFCPGGTQSDYITQWYDNQPTQESATPVAVTAGDDTGSINAVMQPGGSISGTVTAASDGGLGGICVNVNSLDGQFGTGTGTASDGTYTITGLPAGDYQVQFSVGCGNPDNYASQWFDNQPSQSTAATVPVTVGNETDHIDAAMRPGGSISGVVSAAGGGPIAGICATASTADGEWINNSATGADGKYTIIGLGTGDYLVNFDSNGFCPNGIQSNYIGQWYDNQPGPDTATPVAVTAGGDTGSINALMQPAGRSPAPSPRRPVAEDSAASA